MASIQIASLKPMGFSYPMLQPLWLYVCFILQARQKRQTKGKQDGKDHRLQAKIEEAKRNGNKTRCHLRREKYDNITRMIVFFLINHPTAMQHILTSHWPNWQWYLPPPPHELSHPPSLLTTNNFHRFSWNVCRVKTVWPRMNQFIHPGNEAYKLVPRYYIVIPSCI